MTDKDRAACRLVVALLDESQTIAQMAAWLLEQEREPMQTTLELEV